MITNINEREILLAAGRVPNLISREKVLQKIGKAIFCTNKSTQIVALTSDGGYGKTAILNEVRSALTRRNLPDRETATSGRWGDQSLPVAFSEIFDLHNTRFNIRDDLFQALGDSQNWNQPDPHSLAGPGSLSSGLELAFPRFEDAANDYRRMMISGLGQVRLTLTEQQELFEKTFWEEYADRDHAQKFRMVLFLDTVEIFDRISYRWLNQHILPRIEGLESYFDQSTKRLLLNAIQHNRFPNTTIILSGRRNEAARFFNELKQAVDHANIDKTDELTDLKELELEPFSERDIKQYISALIRQQKEIEEIEEIDDNQPKIRSRAEIYRRTNSARIIENLTELRDDEEDIKKIRLLTGGQPIRLAMYISFLFDGRKMINAITEPLAKLQEQVDIEDLNYDLKSGERNPKLLEFRNEIERDFIAQLALSNSLSTRILRLLIRTPRGLTVPQIHFLLDESLIDLDNKEAMNFWYQKQHYSDQSLARLKEIRQEIEWMNAHLFYMVQFDPVLVLDPFSLERLPMNRSMASSMNFTVSSPGVWHRSTLKSKQQIHGMEKPIGKI